MKKLILIGNGGHSKVIKDIVNFSHEYQLKGYLDNNVSEYFEKMVFFGIH